MPRKKIVYLIRRTVGGMQTHLLDLIRGIKNGQFEVVVVAPPNPRLRERLVELSVRLVELDIDDKVKPYKDFRTVLSLKKILREVKPDIFHIHGNKSALVGRFAARLSGLSMVTIVTVHNFLVYQEKGLLKRILASWAERVLARWTDLIIAVSEGLKQSLVSVEGIPAGKIVVIPNGISLKENKDYKVDEGLKKSLGIGEGDTIVGTIGRLVWWKGHKVLIEAASLLLEKYPKLKVIIVGDGPFREELEQKIKQLKLEERIKLLGFVDDIGPYLSLFDVFTLPSLKEPFGIVLLEAMAAKKPIIATRAGGVPEIIEDGKTGILVEPSNSKELAKAIDTAVSDNSLMKRFVEKAYRVVLEKFTIETMVERTKEVYSDCLKGLERKEV